MIKEDAGLEKPLSLFFIRVNGVFDQGEDCPQVETTALKVGNNPAALLFACFGIVKFGKPALELPGQDL
jgi:hypothetical protein